MAKTKQPYQEQIDNLCKDLDITETQYNDKTTIPELEAIIDKLEVELPDGEGQIEVRAVSTFRCRVGDERITVIGGHRKCLPESVAMDALQIGVAVLIGTVV